MASQTSNARLDSLPVEILLKISQLCGTPSALSLCSINRSIRSACYDPLLFKNIVQSSLPESAVENLSRQLELGNREIRDILHPVTTSRRSYITPEAAFWARYALATSEAAAISSESIRTLIVDPYDARNSRAIGRVLSYMPQLLICGYIPSPKALMAVAFAKAGLQVDAIRSDSTTFARFVFCLAAEMLTAPTPAKDRVHDYDALELPILAQEYAEWTGSPVFLEDDGIGHIYSYGVMNIPGITLFQDVFKQTTTPGNQFYNNQVNCQLLIATIAQSLRHQPIEIPQLTAIPLMVHPSYKNLPLPFTFPHDPSSTVSSYTAWTDWEKSYTTYMTDPTVLEEGQWCGCYTVPGAFLQRYGPTPIKFKVLRERLDDASDRMIDVEGSVTTGDDPTRLIGSIGRETGLIRLREEPGGNYGQEWFGVLTPFGMGGVRYDHGEAQSLFWLYKEEWMA